MRKEHFAQGGVKHATINGHRFHLINHDGANYVFINGSQPPLILDQTAADFMAHLIDAAWKFSQTGETDQSDQVREYIVNKMVETYRRPLSLRNRVTRERVGADLDRFLGTIMGIASGECPAQIGLDSKAFSYANWGAPARMDLALTYKCNLACGKCYLPPIYLPELSCEQWFGVLDRLWQLHVPQVVFTGGEPTLFEYLPEIIDHADEFVTGLITNGTMLEQLATQLADASLDYTQVTIESHIADVHNQMVVPSHAGRWPFDPFEHTVRGITAALDAGIQVSTNTTLTAANASHFGTTIDWLARSLEVKNVNCNYLICSGRGMQCQKDNGLSMAMLKQTLEEAIDISDRLGVNFNFYTPTCYSLLNPVELGLGIKQCSAACQNMTIQPDGSVLPCQSWPDTVGNVLTDNWNDIWNHQSCIDLVGHNLADEACNGCQHFEVCGGGCPLDKSERKPTRSC